MPRKSAAELEMTLRYQDATGRNVEANPPQSLTTAAERDAWRELLFRHPQVTTRRNFEGALANYIKLLLKARCPADSREYFEMLHYIDRLEHFLGLPLSGGPTRQRAVAASSDATVVDYEADDGGVYRDTEAGKKRR